MPYRLSIPSKAVLNPLVLRRRWRFAGNRTNWKAGNADASKPLLSDDKMKTAQAFVSPSSLVKEQSTVNINPGHTTQESRSSSSLDIYTEHFGLTERPFTLLPDPDFLFWSDAHSRAYTMLEYGILTRAPITLITGEVGTGKTTLLHHLLKSVDDKVRIGMISNAHGDRGELLRWVLMSLDQPAPAEATYVDLFAAFQTFLIDEYASGHRVILIFDEAQNLSAESLEELRMFTNINSNKDELLQLVLVGQPELREIIRRPDMRQFAQRVSSSFHLTAMDRLTVRKYVGHRLEVAGAERNLFGPAATDKVYEATGGVPRLVNQLCDLAMVYAFTRDRKRVSWNLVQQVLDDGAFFASGMPVEESRSLS